MDVGAAERKLDQLLTGPARANSPALISAEVPLVLYGAGNLGRSTLEKLRSEGVEPVAFADETPGKEGTFVDGVPVMTPATAASKFGDRGVFAVTILNARLGFLEAQRRLEAHGCARVVSFLELARQFAGELLPHYNYQTAESTLAEGEAIRAALALWADEESRRQFTAHVEFQLHADYTALPPPAAENYFPKDVPLPPTDDMIFVDCGAYDGDTIGHFLGRAHGRFRHVYAFEPDPDNCRRLREFVAALDGDARRRIEIVNAGVASVPGRLSFQASGDMGASFGGEGGEMVEVVAVNDAVKAEAGDVVYIKYDVEGAEMDALKGTEQLIARVRPSLAVSVYHRPGDLWKIPLQLASLGAGYNFYLRTQGADGTDVICYAV
jgi:FkbM family methyltransferase